MQSRKLMAALMGLLATTAIAEPNRGIGIYFDQDMMLPVVNEDRDYTMGVALEFFSEDKGLYFLDNTLKQIGDYFGVIDRNEPIRRSYLIGSINYTPDDLSATAPIPNDRPYASVLFLANKRVYADGDVAIGVEGQVGLLGTYVAREVQKTLHGAYRDATGEDEPVDPLGWRNQISAGGELTGRVRVAYAERLAGLSSPGLFDLAWTGDLSLGYQTNASLGLSARAGLINSPFWSLPYDPINRGNFVPAFGSRELYLWGAYRARLVGYDALLQGQFRDSAVTYGGSEINRLVHEAGVGVTGTYEGVQLTMSANMKTAELDQGLAERTHWWGGTYLTIRF